jgi:hypothetical protein
MRSPCCLCVCMCIPPPNQLLNAWINFYETLCIYIYIYYGISAHLNGVLHINPSHQSVYLYV